MNMLSKVRMNTVARALTVKDAGSKELIIELGMAAVAVALLLLYKDQIADVLKSVMATANNAITKAFTKAAGNGTA